jgi:hypothetical protein
LGELKVAGSHIEQLALEGGPYLVVAHQPGALLKAPVGQYTRMQVRLGHQGITAHKKHAYNIKDKPIIYLSAIPHWEDTGFYGSPNDRPTHDIVVDANYYKEKLLGGDHAEGSVRALADVAGAGEQDAEPGDHRRRQQHDPQEEQYERCVESRERGERTPPATLRGRILCLEPDGTVALVERDLERVYTQTVAALKSSHISGKVRA